MIQLDHVLLRTFIACIDAKGFGRAAQRVHRSAATISTHIARLEAETGVVLFLRDTRNLALTREGERLEAYARRILRLHDEVAESFHKPDFRGAITIGAPDDFISQFLPPVLERFGMQYPLADIKVVCAQTTVLAPLVSGSQVDLAIVTRSDGVTGKLVRREPMVWISARDRLALERRPLPVALFEPGSHARKVVLTALEQSNITFRATYESSSLAGLLTIVEAGLAVAAVTRLSAPPHLILPEGAGGLRMPEALDLVLIRGAAASNPLCDAMEEMVFDQQYRRQTDQG
ncbi:LysR substrate-binding domain-containing protein [Pseudogemmobacter blasticus]|uniref:LysR substrate-binding domain-containing protein n=1 Tax=Fuscovulum blasticum TaxID=1075 RepID=UPI001C62E44B|nr:LysR substrate-binding domain-containing protein [Fuscovulum blasticum]